MGSGKSEIDRDEVRRILNRLKANVKELHKGAGSPDEVGRMGYITPDMLGGAEFPPAGQLTEVVNKVHSYLNKEYAAFAQSYDKIVQGLFEQLDGHVKKEETMISNMGQNVGATNLGNQYRSNSADFYSA